MRICNFLFGIGVPLFLLSCHESDKDRLTRLVQVREYAMVIEVEMAY